MSSPSAAHNHRQLPCFLLVLFLTIFWKLSRLVSHTSIAFDSFSFSSFVQKKSQKVVPRDCHCCQPIFFLFSITKVVSSMWLWHCRCLLCMVFLFSTTRIFPSTRSLTLALVFSIRSLFSLNPYGKWSSGIWSMIAASHFNVQSVLSLNPYASLLSRVWSTIVALVFNVSEYCFWIDAYDLCQSRGPWWQPCFLSGNFPKSPKCVGND